ncbi:hypothetical protein [Candidatus Ruthia endofausta]|nr:hypothetical protein [Candidatus Ruthia endofausta]
MGGVNGNSAVFNKGMQVASYDADGHIDTDAELTGWLNYLNGK